MGSGATKAVKKINNKIVKPARYLYRQRKWERYKESIEGELIERQRAVYGNMPHGFLDENLSPSSRLEIFVSCIHLPNLQDLFSKTDPQIMAYVRTDSGEWMEHGRTELIMDDLDPKFVTPIIFDYFFGEKVDLKFNVVDVDDHISEKAGKKRDETRDTLVGYVIVSVDELVTSQGSLMKDILNDKVSRDNGKMSIVVEEVKNFFDIGIMKMRANLLKKKLLRSLRPFVEISRSTDTGGYIPVYRTKHGQKASDKNKSGEWEWEEVSATLQRLANGDYDRRVKFDVLDWDRLGEHVNLGTFETTFRSLFEDMVLNYDLNGPNKRGHLSSAGSLVFDRAEVRQQYSFLDYLKGGCEVQLIIGIDFTASNGNPNLRNSLHYNGGEHANEYIRALSQVANIVGAYDSDQMFPVYGFGAKIPPSEEISHCFPLNGSAEEPEVFALDGIIQAYKSAVSNVVLHGPTIFSHIVNVAISYCEKHTNTQSAQKYFILFILTDGSVNDMDDTVRAIVRASKLPLSIIIVGVGDNDFSNMDTLDADLEPLKTPEGEIQARDIVQFVPFREYQSDERKLAKAVLQEVPMQLLSFMTNNKIIPNSSNPKLSDDIVEQKANILEKKGKTAHEIYLEQRQVALQRRKERARAKRKNKKKSNLKVTDVESGSTVSK